MRENPWVLIVDDDQQDYYFIEEIIHEKIPEVQLHYRNSFNSGMSAIKSTEYQMAILDYDLGIKKGNEILEAIKAADQKITVVFISGNNNPKIAEQLKSAGAAAVFHKDELDSNQFCDFIQGSLRNSSTAQS